MDDNCINGTLEINNLIEVIQGKQTHKGTIQSVKDCSLYTVGKFLKEIFCCF